MDNGFAFDDNTDIRTGITGSGNSNASMISKATTKSDKSSKFYGSGRESKFRLKFRGNKGDNGNSNDTIERLDSTNMVGNSSDTLTYGKLDTRPELTIQTTGHLSLTIPKRIGSLILLEDPGYNGGKKAQVSSPASTFHNLFHRTSTSAQPLNDTRINENEELSTTSNRIPISLSSNSSNSNVIDQVLASTYNFANPDFTSEDVDISTSSSIQELQRKLLTPTDQYLLGKVRCNSTTKLGTAGFGISPQISASNNSGIHLSNSGLSIIGSPDNSINTSFSEIGLSIANDTLPRAEEYSSKNYKFYIKLFTLVKLLCCPSQYRKQPNGFLFPFLGLTVEKVTHFVKEGYVQHFPQVPDIDDFHIREVTLDLTLFYSQCLSALKIDSSMPQNLSPHNGQLGIDILMSCWTKLEFQWTIFKEKIRFYLMLIFQPLQKYLKDFSTIKIDRILFASFKDNMLTPFLVQRLSNFHNFHDEERKSLKSNMPLVRNMINCFSLLTGKAIVDSNNPLAATFLFNDTYEMLCNIEDDRN
ncbi:uncharacterized protein KQ657_004222 [Scheffersomyces spartinae]|uniref:Uncharacterized protein n=1 Tax=Scheffersomyces spartinae TaxID=45513 RepID=A0A9P8AJR7_9ASCO|nr:uncharacterized protein KQ657_004222 [Scheffersomyces spartinae]KAG7195105.1 hypothetical protein KQ657_004222 [Scheffersomyces spartinae]